MQRKLYHNVNLSSIKETILALPPKEPTSFSSMEIVSALKPQIESVLKAGYTYVDIAHILFDAHQIKLSPATLKREYSKLTISSKSKSKQSIRADLNPSLNVKQVGEK